MKMNLKRLIAVAIVFATIGCVGTLQADVLNGGFESGDFQGWRLNIPRASASSAGSPRLTGAATVTTQWTGPNTTSPVQSILEGNYFTVLSSYSDVGQNSGRAFNITLTQRIHLMAGETIFGAAGFHGLSRSTRDSAWVNVLDHDGISLASPWRSSSNTNSDASVMSWSDWSWQATVEGDYYLGLGLTTYCSETSPSYGFFDGIFVHPVESIAPVPEPSVLSLVTLAVAAVVGFRKKLKATDH